MLATVNASGYTGVTVANVIARAGISRRTFYELFTDKEDCLLALYRDISKHLADQIADAINGCPAERTVLVVVEQMFEHAESRPAQAWFLVNDALAGGRGALQERAHAIDQISRRVQARHAIASTQAAAPDVPMQAVIGATQWLIAQRLRRGERHLMELARELTKWLTLYDRPIGEHQWSTLSPGPIPAPCEDPAELGDRHPSPACSGRSARCSSEQSGDRRWRILVASAESAVQSGYAASTLTAIMARTGLRKGAFYDCFHDKHQAFLAVHELAFKQSMDIGAAAYFSANPWPERVWRCMLATSEFYAANPALAYVGFVETHALGLPAIQRVEESRRVFTTLLRIDNKRASPRTSPLLSTAVAEATGAAIFEIGHDQIRRQHATDLPRYAYHATYLALVPFLGIQAASRFVARKLTDAAR